jgi:hypothetical protein
VSKTALFGTFWKTGNSPDCHPVDRIDELANY